MVTTDMADANPRARRFVTDLLGAENVYEMRYLPEFYQLRDRVKAVVQTGDYGVHSNVVLVAGYPSPSYPTGVAHLLPVVRRPAQRGFGPDHHPSGVRCRSSKV